MPKNTAAQRLGSDQKGYGQTGIGSIGALMTMMAIEQTAPAGMSWKIPSTFPTGTITSLNISSKVQAVALGLLLKGGGNVKMYPPPSQVNADIVIDGTDAYECKHSQKPSGSSATYDLKIELTAKKASSGNGKKLLDALKAMFGEDVYTKSGGNPTGGALKKAMNGTMTIKGKSQAEVKALGKRLTTAMQTWLSDNAEGVFVPNVGAGPKGVEVHVYFADIDSAASAFGSVTGNTIKKDNYKMPKGGTWRRPRFGCSVSLTDKAVLKWDMAKWSNYGNKSLKANSGFWLELPTAFGARAVTPADINQVITSDTNPLVNPFQSGGRKATSKKTIPPKKTRKKTAKRTVSPSGFDFSSVGGTYRGKVRNKDAGVPANIKILVQALVNKEITLDVFSASKRPVFEAAMKKALASAKKKTRASRSTTKKKGTVADTEIFNALKSEYAKSGNITDSIKAVATKLKITQSSVREIYDQDRAGIRSGGKSTSAKPAKRTSRRTIRKAKPQYPVPPKNYARRKLPSSGKYRKAVEDWMKATGKGMGAFKKLGTGSKRDYDYTDFVAANENLDKYKLMPRLVENVHEYNPEIDLEYDELLNDPVMEINPELEDIFYVELARELELAGVEIPTI